MPRVSAPNLMWTGIPVWVVAAAVLATVGLVVIVGFHAKVTRAREGKVLAFVVLFLLPLGAMSLGFSQHMTHAQSTQFCVSCHVMSEHGKSLYVDNANYVPARHFQNNLVARDSACYACHSDYTMFGGVRAKIRGLRHLFIEYLGTIPAPEDIQLYEPYQNANCLHCHLGARQFEEGAVHRSVPGLLERVKAGKQSCLSAGCHSSVHAVADQKNQKFWEPE